MFCPDCGHELNTNLKFCPNCGKSLSQNTNIKDNVIQRSQVGSSSVGSINISPVIEIKTTQSTNIKNSIKIVLLLLVACGLALLVFSNNEPDSTGMANISDNSTNWIGISASNSEHEVFAGGIGDTVYIEDATVSVNETTYKATLKKGIVIANGSDSMLSVGVKV